MSINLTPLTLAIAALERAIAVVRRADGDATPADVREVLQAGLIQSFEFTYELAWKTMRRTLGDELGAMTVDGLSRRELFRLAQQQLLLTDVERWMDYHQARNLTSHVYDQVLAASIAATAMAFFGDADDLLDRLRARSSA